MLLTFPGEQTQVGPLASENVPCAFRPEPTGFDSAGSMSSQIVLLGTGFGGSNNTDRLSKSLVCFYGHGQTGNSKLGKSTDKD